MKIYVTHKLGRRIAGLGSRRWGEYFEVDAKTGKDLLAQPGFSKDDPARDSAPVKPAKTSGESPAIGKDHDDAS